MASAFPNDDKGDGFNSNTNAKPVSKGGDIEHWQAVIINGFIKDGRIPTKKEFEAMLEMTGLTIDQIRKYISIKRCSSRKGRDKCKPEQYDRNTGRRLSETNPPPHLPHPPVPQSSNVSQAAKKRVDKCPLLSSDKRKPEQFDRNTGRRLSETNPPHHPHPPVPQSSNVSQAAKKRVDKCPLLSSDKRKPGQFDRNTGRRVSETNPPPTPRPPVPQTSNLSEAAKRMMDKNPILTDLLAKEKMKLSYSGVSELSNAPPNETLSLYDPPVQDNLPAELSSGVKDLLLREGSNWPSTHPVPIPTLGSLPSKGVRARTNSNRESSQYDFASSSRESSPAMDEYSRYLSSTCHSQSTSPSKKARFKKPTCNTTQTEPLDLSPVKKVRARTDSRDCLPGNNYPFASTEDNIQYDGQNLSRHDYSETSAGNPDQTEPLDYSKKKNDYDSSDEGGSQRH